MLHWFGTCSLHRNHSLLLCPAVMSYRGGKRVSRVPTPGLTICEHTGVYLVSSPHIVRCVITAGFAHVLLYIFIPHYCIDLSYGPWTYHCSLYSNITYLSIWRIYIYMRIFACIYLINFILDKLHAWLLLNHALVVFARIVYKFVSRDSPDNSSFFLVRLVVGVA